MEIGFVMTTSLRGLQNICSLWFVIYYAVLIYKPHSIIPNFTDMFKDPNTNPGTCSAVQFGPERLSELIEMNNYEQFNEATIICINGCRIPSTVIFNIGCT
jgi:hypothetical protein